ncbi:MAG: alpha/beta hydrolase [Gammaproteobacteria bacterium]|nr:alpha/beta hydrolase [Gammaproteobacteria bacterium]
MEYVAFDDVKIAYDLDDYTDPWADSQVVLLHHGYARNRKFWYPWGPLLSRDYRCLRMDMRGHGDSTALAADHTPTLENLCEDTIRLMDALKIEKIHFVGESLAGVIGIWLGAHHPDRLHSAVLLSTPVKVSEQGMADFSAGHASWEAAFDTLTPVEWARVTMGHRYDLATTDPAYIEWVLEQNARTPVSSLRKYAQLIGALDLSQGIPAVEVPTLLVAGGSKLAPPEQTQFLRDSIPNAQMELLSDARHLVGYSHPEQTAKLCLEFWARLAT